MTVFDSVSIEHGAQLCGTHFDRTEGWHGRS